MNRPRVVLTAIVLLCLPMTLSWGQPAVSDEAKRHFDRGMAAVEMAKSPEDYGAAIKEFEQAVRLAPDWPDAYYNLGTVQATANKYSAAIANLKQYLRLAPNAADVAAVKTLINKLEFKAEQEITDEQALDMFGSLGGPQWEIHGKRCKWDVLAMKGFRRAGHKILVRHIYQVADKTLREVPGGCEVEATVIGRRLNYTSGYIVHTNVPPPATRLQAYETKVELEIVSHTKVKAKSTTTFSWDHSVVDRSTYEFVKKKVAEPVSRTD
ncbi:MAG TPA: tetratricopeptide repeat protein [Planctomycetota bacterium]|nr:tetratricopeptide repeat protein [Planctomycetota bacterium]